MNRLRLGVMRRMHWWPPLLGAGIRVTRLDADVRAIDVEMRLAFFNRNVMGSHFGGSLYAMTDPFYMMMLMENLGGEYVVWDKAATIRYRRPGMGTVRAEFRLTLEKIAEIRGVLEVEERCEPVFLIEVRDAGGRVVAEVEKTIYCAKISVHEAIRANKSRGLISGGSRFRPSAEMPHPSQKLEGWGTQKLYTLRYLEGISAW